MAVLFWVLVLFYRKERRIACLRKGFDSVFIVSDFFQKIQSIFYMVFSQRIAFFYFLFSLGRLNGIFLILLMKRPVFLNFR